MKRFPFIVLFICIVAPPLAYLSTLHYLEGFFRKKEYSNLQEALIQNTDALYEGRYSVQEEVNRNILHYLNDCFLYKLGPRPTVMVKTGDDRILYPTHLDKDAETLFETDGTIKDQDQFLNYVEVASRNYQILNQGLELTFDIEIRHNTWMSNLILFLYVGLFGYLAQKTVRGQLKEIATKSADSENRLKDLKDKLEHAEQRMGEIVEKEKAYVDKIQKMKKEKENIEIDVDGLLDEMVAMEAALADQKEMKSETEQEVFKLREEVDQLKTRLERSKHKEKRKEKVQKRFKVLYKNLMFTDKAIEGYLDLPDNFQLKAEEVINLLDKDDLQISIKRKVFGKGGKKDILEIEFSYSGRIYIKKKSTLKTTVLAVGTKNTQDHDLAFLEGVD
jgi:hypothetical protein